MHRDLAFLLLMSPIVYLVLRPHASDTERKLKKPLKKQKSDANIIFCWSHNRAR